MPDQTWNPDRYARNARFVAELGMPVVELLNPQPGERILDLGCGDGALTEKLVALGCRVVGVDSSTEQIEAARALGLDAHVVDARNLRFETEFEAVFSNAALHWIPQAEAVIDGVWRALKPGGRFVGEMGGQGNIAHIKAAMAQALAQRGIKADDVFPWYFPSPSEYQGRLEKGGFVVDSITLIPRPTPLPGNLIAWLETFAEGIMTSLTAEDRPAFLSEVQETLRPTLCDEQGNWTADYVRLRFAALKNVER